MFASLMLLAAWSARASAAVKGSDASLPKVITMLRNMHADGDRMIQEEKVAFAKFDTYCNEETRDLNAAIAQANTNIEALAAHIAAQNDKIRGTGDEMAALQGQVASDSATLQREGEMRAKEHADFVAKETDLKESVSALQRAIRVLSEKTDDIPATASALLQVSGTPGLPAAAKSLIASFLTMSNEQDPLAYEAPEANAYEFHSSGIIDMLEKLQKKFDAELHDAQVAESNAAHASSMKVQDLTDSVANGQAGISRSKEIISSLEQDVATSTVDRDANSRKLAMDTNTLGALDTECSEKRLSFKEKQDLRVNEQEALKKAIEILESATVQSGAALAQLRRGAGTEGSEGIRHRVEQFVSSEAKRLHSEGLQLLAQRIVADPFAKVTKLIKDLIARLQEEQSAATTHKDYCDTNMGKSKLDHDKLTKDLDHLDLELKQDKAEIAAKTTEIAELSSQVAEVTQKLSEATALRKQENEDNKATIEDAKAAQQAVESAIKILTDFYEGASSATAFAQKSASHGSSFVSTKETPVIGGALWNSLATPDEGNVDTDHVEGMQTFGEKYVGQTDKAGSVLALMQVLVGDFANLQAETEAAEQLALKQYTALVSDLTTDRKLAEQQSDQAEGRVAALKQKVTEDTRDFELVEDKKLAHERFQVTLEQQCVDKGSSFEERQQKRREEIKSLQEAYDILDRSVS